ncbi:MAG: hypothetical protein IVW54_09700 [Candidatus Binataceae bacterium]|nr:hypothetical protein [Candidatus Binataceae bacterium]
MSWAAVIAGAFVAAALWLILLVLGTGMGLSAVSPWSNSGASASTIGKGGIVWLIIIQIIASGLGGYLAGRLRTKWATIHTDEVYFRDTAHGFLAWSVGLVVTAAFLASAATSMVAAAAQQTSSISTSSGSVGAQEDNSNAYFIDTLFRSRTSSLDRPDAQLRSETNLIFATALSHGHLSDADHTYLARQVAAKTGLDEATAEQRVSEVFAEMQSAAETARKAAAHFSLWLFVSLLIGAFCASYAATIGGRERDHVQLI